MSSLLNALSFHRSNYTVDQQALPFSNPVDIGGLDNILDEMGYSLFISDVKKHVSTYQEISNEGTGHAEHGLRNLG